MLEHFRDGYAISALGVSSGQPLSGNPPLYARARLYAKSIDHVASLERDLRGQRIETTSRLADIENVKSINRVLGSFLIRLPPPRLLVVLPLSLAHLSPMLIVNVNILLCFAFSVLPADGGGVRDVARLPAQPAGLCGWLRYLPYCQSNI
jgi:hypothetical protein